MTASVRVLSGPKSSLDEEILSAEALSFIANLHCEFEQRRKDLLQRRLNVQERLNQGWSPDFDSGSKSIREGNWKVAQAPTDLEDRRVEITGPCDRKMMINALNSGAKVFMADLEDAQSPSWDNVLEGHANLYRAVRREIDFTNDQGKSYKVKPDSATLIVRPRGWHLTEAHVLIDDIPVSASLFDFGLHFFHNAKELLQRGSGPYFYLPKLEHSLEARLWNDVFVFSQNSLGLPQSTIRATVLIETILAAFQMDEILYELKDHASGLNAGRWDYIFSIIKRLRSSDVVLPDRSMITMNVPFMRSYSELLVRTCHKRGAHAIGGMAAFIPSRKDPEVTAHAVAQVTKDKEREAHDGFDGTWVAHPDLVPVAMQVFDGKLGSHPHQKGKLRADVLVTDQDLLPCSIEDGEITERGLRLNIRVALQYIERWLAGLGAVAIDHLMEDAATAEISRAQIWQWIHQGAALSDGRAIDHELYQSIRKEELERLAAARSYNYESAAKLLDQLILAEEFEEFLTLPAYRELSFGSQGASLLDGGNA